MSRTVDHLTLNPDWEPIIQFCTEDKQVRFAEFYPIFASGTCKIYIERFTGYLWRRFEISEEYDFVSSGLTEFFLLGFVYPCDYYDDIGITNREEIYIKEHIKYNNDTIIEIETIRQINDGTFISEEESDLLLGMIDAKYKESSYFVGDF